MKCANCSFDNAADAKFCENCGKPLENNCPNCGKPVAPNAKFCRTCGYHLAGTTAAPASRLADLQQAAPAALQNKMRDARAKLIGERKLVTVLFTDIVGSTALAEKLDPEDWGEIVAGAHRRVSEAVYRYEGTIAQLLGDGVLAFFGAPVTHEDDPVRAAKAALDIQTAIKQYAHELAANKRVDNFLMRCGLNTGLVVVGNIGSDLHMEYLALGDTVNLAARMQSAAAPGTVLVADHTARWIKHAFDLESRGELEVKGKSEPVPAFRVIAPKVAPASARGIEGLDSPLVGREREMQTLQSCIDQLRRGQGQIISVSGEAGLGKSRLMAEVRKTLTKDGGQQTDGDHSVIGLPSSVTWLEGRALSYESSTPYAPFIDLFSRLYQLRADEEDAAKYDRIRDSIQRIAQNHLETAPFIGTILGIKLEGEDLERVRYLEPPQLREKIFQAVFHLFERLARKQPIVILLDDLHWADSVSIDLLERLMGLTSSAPAMILALFRPQRQEPAWRFHETAQRDYPHRYTAIALEPLDEASSRQLVANLLEIEDLPEKVRGLILKKAEGNPFYVEEVIRSLLDAKLVVRQDSHWRATREIETIQVPDTLVGVIGARLDRLDQESKRTAQTAAVIGREFQLEILQDISEAKPQLSDALETLQRRELIREKNHVPVPAYIFKHALTQETAYASLLMSKRREVHKRVAECLERLAPDRVNDIAWHFVQAQENTRALPYLVQAGERALREYSTQEAIAYFSRAAESAETSQETALARAAFEGLGSALMLTANAPRALQNYQTMMQYAQLHRDAPMLVSAHNKLAFVAMFGGDFENVEKHLHQAEQLARSAEDRPGLSEMFTIRCQICTASGDFETAVKYLRESTQIGQALNRQEQVTYSLTHTANTLMFLTRYDEAFAKAEEAMRMSEQIGDRAHEAELLTLTFPPLYIRNGDLDTARKLAEQGTSMALRIGSTMATTFGCWVQGIIARMRGEYQDAVDHFEQSLSAAKTGMPMFLVLPLGSLGTTLLEISPRFADKSMALHTEALKLMEHPVPASMGGVGWAEIGFCALGLEDAEKADELFQKGLNYPTTQGLMYKAVHLLGAAHVALLQKRFDDAARLAQEARVYVDERKMQQHYADIALVDARVSAARGDTAHALDQFARAEQRASEMKMRPIVWQARAGAAKVLAAMSRTAEADAKRQAARAMIDEIAGLFQDAELRAAFVESAMKKIDG